MTVHPSPALFALDPKAVARATGGQVSRSQKEPGVVFCQTSVRPEPICIVIGTPGGALEGGFGVRAKGGTPDFSADERKAAWAFVFQKLLAADLVRQPDTAHPPTANEQPSSFSDLITEDILAEAFAAKFRDEFRFCEDKGGWMRWDGAVWHRDRMKNVFQAARKFVREFVQDEKDNVREKAGRYSTVAAVERYARNDEALVTTADEWDADAFLLGTPAGTVNLRTGHLRSGRHADLISMATAVAPAERADCPRWLQFLREATGGDAELIGYLKRAIGYSLTGDTREHSLLFAHGPGGAGKGTFINTIAGIMGAYATTAPMDTFMASGDRHPTELARLDGVRLVTASENEEGRAWAEAKIKGLTGGDTIAARFMNRDFFEFLPQFKLFIVGNHPPVLKNVDEAMRRRLQIVPFVNKPAKKDTLLPAKLKEEGPAILRWAIEGCLEWQKVGLNPPGSVLVATSEYFEEQDLFGEWLVESCDAEPDNPHKTASSAALYASWSAFAKAAGEAPGTRRSFSAAMQRRGFRLSRTMTARSYSGIRIKPLMQLS